MVFIYKKKKAHKHYKLIKYASRLASGAIASGGITSVIVSGSVLTIISLGASALLASLKIVYIFLRKIFCFTFSVAA